MAVLAADHQQQEEQHSHMSSLESSATSEAVKCLSYWTMRQPLLLAGYANGNAKVWDTAAGVCIASFCGQRKAAITAIAGSPINNKLMATAGLDRRLHFFDVNQRKLLRECKTHAPINDMVREGPT